MDCKTTTDNLKITWPALLTTAIFVFVSSAGQAETKVERAEKVVEWVKLYDANNAIAASVGPTVSTVAVGVGLLIGGARKENTNLVISGAATGLGGIGLCPSIGYHYIGEHLQGIARTGLRMTLMAATWGSGYTGEAAVMLFPVTALATIGFTIKDMVDLGDATRDANRRNLEKPKKGKIVELTPAVACSEAGRSLSAGLVGVF